MSCGFFILSEPGAVFERFPSHVYAWEKGGGNLTRLTLYLSKLRAGAQGEMKSCSHNGPMLRQWWTQMLSGYQSYLECVSLWLLLPCCGPEVEDRKLQKGISSVEDRICIREVAGSIPNISRTRKLTKSSWIILSWMGQLLDSENGSVLCWFKST